MRTVIFCMGLCVVGLLAGCSTTRGPQLMVGNASQETLVHVQVATAAGQYKFINLAPHSVSTGQALLDVPPVDCAIQWKTQRGQEFSTNVTIRGPLPKGFRGGIQCQIDRQSNVTIFLLSEEGGHASEMPWSVPAQWEGSPMIPGMNQR